MTNTTPQFDALLSDWTLDGAGRLHGIISCDKKEGREPFKDGERIITSRLQYIDRVNGVPIAQTRNTRYILCG